MLFLKDFASLQHQQYVYQWGTQNFANSALMALQPGGRVGEVMLQLVLEVKSFRPQVMLKPLTMVAERLPDLHVYPPSVFDPAWVPVEQWRNASPYFGHNFTEFFTRDLPGGDTSLFFPDSYAFHWHNEWQAHIRQDSIAGRFLALHTRALGLPVTWHAS